VCRFQGVSKSKNAIIALVLAGTGLTSSLGRSAGILPALQNPRSQNLKLDRFKLFLNNRSYVKYEVVLNGYFMDGRPYFFTVLYGAGLRRLSTRQRTYPTAFTANWP
jgi:hypothetical protein